MDEEEILDVVNKNDEVIGQIARRNVDTLLPVHGKYVRSANVFVMRSNGDIWVPTRSMHKAIAPGGLDFSTGGHIQTGESYETAALRELWEEAGLEASAADLIFIDVFPLGQYISRLYLLRTDATPQLGDEHTAGSWLSPAELQRRLEQGVHAKSALLPNLKLLLEYLNKNR